MRISLGLLRREMAAAKPGSRFLVDGFPRNFDNVQVGVGGYVNEHSFLACIRRLT